MKYINSKQIKTDWASHLSGEFKADYLIKLDQFLEQQAGAGKQIFPEKKDIFSAFNLTPLSDVKVVIIGQDPYHNDDQAHGLSFSVRPGIKIPPSLRNMYKELQSDLGIGPAAHGYLESWAKQGVLMLNAVLTVEAHQAGSHQKKGWEQFTDKVVEVLNSDCQGLVFLLWGAHAHKKGANIDRNKHLVLESVHPSPLSARRGFFGCQHFSKSNKYLESIGKSTIDWQLPQID